MAYFDIDEFQNVDSAEYVLQFTPPRKYCITKFNELWNLKNHFTNH